MGAIEAMISTIKENRRVRSGRKTMRDRGDDYAYESNERLVFNDTMSKQEHEQHQLEWKHRKRKSTIKLGIVFGVMILTVASFLIWIAS